MPEERRGLWDEADLVRRLLRALEVAERALKALGLEGYADPENPEVDVRPEKVISETALLLLAAHRVREPNARRRVHHLAGLLAPFARGERVRAGICLEPQLARDHAFAHTCLSVIGYRDDDLDRLLSASLQDQASSGHERLAHRDLEQEWLARLQNQHSALRCEDDRLPARSMLGTGLDPVGCRRDDIYAFTHALIYFTDIGSRRHQLPRPVTAIVEEAESALARCLDDEDYDLGGEVLLTWPLLHQRWTPTASFGFVALATVEDAAGFLPAPIIKVDRYRSLTGEARSRSGRGASEALFGLLEQEGRARHWQATFTGLDPSQREDLAPMLLNMSLRRATRAVDLPAVRSALEIGAAYGLTSTASARRSAALLRRASNAAVRV